jgi:ABC-type oligopeptide transport system substrate-binding subunit
MKRKLLGALVVAAAVATALAACGGSSQPEATQPADPNLNNNSGVSEPPKTDPEPANTVPDTPPPPT